MRKILILIAIFAGARALAQLPKTSLPASGGGASGGGITTAKALAGTVIQIPVPSGTGTVVNDNMQFAAVSTTGRPRYVYSSAADLHFVNCTDEYCQTYIDTKVVTDSGTVHFPVLLIGSDTFARLFYVVGTSLKFVKCGNANCTSTTTATLVTTTNNHNFSVVMASGDKPWAVFDDHADVRLYQCADSSCSSGSNVDLDGDFSQLGSSRPAIGSDGFLRVVYVDVQAHKIYLLKCGDIACSSPVRNVVLAYTDASFPYVSLFLSGGSVPVISYNDTAWYSNHTAGSGLNVAVCNADCSSVSAKVVDPDQAVIEAVMSAGPDGFPRIAYVTNTAQDAFSTYTAELRYAVCLDLACASFRRGVATTAGWESSMVLDADGLPVIVTTTQGNEAWQVIRGTGDGLYGSVPVNPVGVTASGSSCTITSILNGRISGATCTP